MPSNILSVDIKNIEAVRKSLDKYLNLQTKILLVAKKLCEIGEPIIRETHGSHASIGIIPEDKGYSIQAEGEQLLFIEFGTGDMGGVTDVLYDQVPDSVGMGTWSKDHAMMYTRYGFWVFGGQIYHYTEPHPAFYYAYQAMVEALPRIVSEVFE